MCNCVARNDEEGVELDDADDNTVAQNLVALNGTDGILVKESKENAIRQNSVLENEDDGIVLDNDADKNEVTCNKVQDNGEDGIDLDYSDKNQIRANEVWTTGTIVGRTVASSFGNRTGISWTATSSDTTMAWRAGSSANPDRKTIGAAT